MFCSGFIVKHYIFILRLKVALCKRMYMLFLFVFVEYYLNFYSKNKVSSGNATRAANMSIWQFQHSTIFIDPDGELHTGMNTCAHFYVTFDGNLGGQCKVFHDLIFYQHFILYNLFFKYFITFICYIIILISNRKKFRL